MNKIRPRRASAVLAGVALTVGAGTAARATELEPGTAAVVTTTQADGSRTISITSANSFDQREFDSAGRLTHEFAEDDRNVVETWPLTGAIHRFARDGSSSDDRFEQFERTYRFQIAAGLTRVVGSAEIAGQPAYELAATDKAAHLNYLQGEDPKLDERVFVDQQTWVPLRIEQHTASGVKVLADTTTRIVPASEVAPTLTRSAVTARATRRRHAKR